MGIVSALGGSPENYRQLKSQYSAYRMLLEKMNCAVLEYDVKQNTLIANRTFMEKFADNEPYGKPLTMSRLREIHPEFNYSELESALETVYRSQKPSTFETAITFSDGKIYWVEITIIPQFGSGGNTNKLLVAAIDTTKAHENDDSYDVIVNTPSGIHRCYLNQPIHMEFASNGMCSMLGYTEAELNEKLTADRKLSRLVHPEDLDAFIEFVQKAIKAEGHYRYQYRLQKKDGSYISVIDDMYVKRASSGVLYGYSSVTDITDYQQAGERAKERLLQAQAEIEKHKNLHRQEVADLESRLHDAQLKNSISQMQPHFLYNALASIREIVLENPRYASDLIYDFSTHLRACVRAMSNDDLIPFSQEIENVNAYINIERMRFGDKLKTRFEIADKDFDIVPLSIQPLVENAIRHGIYERGAGGGTLTVTSELTDSCHLIRVCDDGVGFNYDQVKKETEEHKRDSTGLCNLIFRLKKIMDAEISVDSTPGVGTTVTVMIPRKEVK